MLKGKWFGGTPWEDYSIRRILGTKRFLHEFVRLKQKKNKKQKKKINFKQR